ncbi:c-type cytochrome [Azomonas macrocytogenes]|uniref:Cytochrome c553 n=1 Tax=Azomonas macrocytogenes TaxID=69962 RepID=A0A839T2N8_AZOMA|nr:cytochrome c553 [Azomonas macrocytogenes]
MKRVLASLLLALGLVGQVQAQGDPQAGRGKAALCGACHGMDGNSPVPNFPKLAGQGEPYLLKQLREIKAGSGRKVFEMTGMLDARDEQELADIAAYFAMQKPLSGYADPALVERGEQLFRGGDMALGVPACSGCHAPDGVGNGPARFPRLAGQHSAYTAKQLNDFRDGVRSNDGDAMPMRAIAARLGKRDIEALASYIQGLH